eukprot:436982-Rhodomonas_salina.1
MPLTDSVIESVTLADREVLAAEGGGERQRQRDRETEARTALRDGRERERERHREAEREREAQRGTERERGREGGRERESERDADRSSRRRILVSTVSCSAIRFRFTSTTCPPAPLSVTWSLSRGLCHVGSVSVSVMASLPPSIPLFLPLSPGPCASRAQPCAARWSRPSL